MRKIFLCLLLVLTGGVASAADFLGTFSDYRLQVRMKLNVAITNSSYIPDTTIDQFVREGIVAVTPLVRGDRGMWSTQTLFRRDSYVMDSLVQGVQSVMISSNDTVKSLLYVPKTKWYQMEHRTTIGQKDPYMRRPSYYDYYDNTLYVFPAPTLVGDSIKVDVWRKLSNISTSPTITNLHQLARIAVLNYAAWQVAQAKQHPLAMLLKAEYERSLSDVSGSIDGNWGSQTNASNPQGSISSGTASSTGSASSSN